MTPQRIQLHRGGHLPRGRGVVKVDRSTRWGNPFPTNEHGQERSVELFAQFLATGDRQYMKDGHVVTYPSDEEIRRQLAGRTLACWCGPEERCHATVLLAIANSAKRDQRKESHECS